MIGPRHALRTLRREWRLPELRTLIAALLLSVTALGAVGTLATRVQRAVVMSAAELIGGDLGIDAASPLPAAATWVSMQLRRYRRRSCTTRKHSGCAPARWPISPASRSPASAVSCCRSPPAMARGRCAES